MESRLKNTLLSVRRYQRPLKLAFIIADEDVSGTIGNIINWCSFDVSGAVSLIYSSKSLENRFNQSLIKEHDPDIFIKVGKISKSDIECLENKYQPFNTWEWDEIKDSENYPTNLIKILSYKKFPVQECYVSSKKESDELFLLSATLFGFLLPKQREGLKEYLKILDDQIYMDDPIGILKHQPYGGIINLCKMLFWGSSSESYDNARCYDVSEKKIEVYHDCLVIDGIDNWDNLSLFWNLRAHFGRRIRFLPRFIVDDKKEVLIDFFWNDLKDNHNLTILSNSLATTELLRLLNSLPNARLEKKNSDYILKLTRGDKSKFFKIKTKADDWSEVCGKIRIAFGRNDKIPVHFSERGGMVEMPEPTLFDPKSYGSYAVDFEIPFFKPTKSESLRYGLGLGSETRISSLGLTAFQGLFSNDKFVPIRAVDSMEAIKYIVSDYGFDVRESDKGKMATRLLSMLKSLYELHILSGEDVVSFLKQSNPLIRNEERKTIKKPDEDAAINFSRISEFLNIQKESYLTRQFAEKIVTWMVNHGFLKLGAKITCENCFNKQWISIDQIKQRMACNACFSEIQMPMNNLHHLEWSYLLNVLLGESIDQGFLAHLLTIHYLTYENRLSAEKITYFYPGINIFKNGTHIAELDLYVVSENEVIIGECRIGSDITEKDIDKVISISEDLCADVVLFCTLDNFSKECIDLINKKASQTLLKIVVLQRDQLLNQTFDRKLKKLHFQQRGSEKSYRQLFIEDIMRL